MIMYDTIFGTISLIAFIADIIFIIAIIVGTFGLIIIFRDWLYQKKHDSQNQYKDYHDKK